VERKKKLSTFIVEVIKQHTGKISKPFHSSSWNGVLSSILIHNSQFSRINFILFYKIAA